MSIQHTALNRRYRNWHWQVEHTQPHTATHSHTHTHTHAHKRHHTYVEQGRAALHVFVHSPREVVQRQRRALGCDAVHTQLEALSTTPPRHGRRNSEHRSSPGEQSEATTSAHLRRSLARDMQLVLDKHPGCSNRHPTRHKRS